MSARDKLIEMIDEIDGVSANDTVVIMDLIKWLPEHQVAQFVEDTIETHRLYDDFTSLEDCVGGPEAEEDIKYPVQGPSWPTRCDEDYFFNEGVKAAEAAKQARVERYLQLMQCSEV